MHLADAAIRESGIVADHAKKFTDVVQQNNQFILFRKVEKWATGLIAENFPTKDLHVKGKSSTWGPQAGLICCDQALSKLHGSSGDVITSFNQKIKDSLGHGFAVEAPLVISEQRLLNLAALGALSIEHRAPNGVRKVTAKDKVFHLLPTAVAQVEQRNAVARFTGAFAAMRAVISSVAASGLWVFQEVAVHGQIKDRRLVTVLANGAQLPLTADYDVFAICPHLSVGAVPLPAGASAHLKWKATVGAVRTALGQGDRRTVDQDLGRMSLLQRQSKDALNRAAIEARYGGGNVVHHGTEADNPVTELDFPVTVFVPGASRGVYGCENQVELERLVADILRAGYAFYGNRLWQTRTGAIAPGRSLEQSKMMRAWDASFTVGTAFEVLSPLDLPPG